MFLSTNEQLLNLVTVALMSFLSGKWLFSGHFYLTNLLLDKMKHTANSTGIEGRIVNLSSVAHVHTYGGGIRFDRINDKDRFCALPVFSRQHSVECELFPIILAKNDHHPNFTCSSYSL